MSRILVFLMMFVAVKIVAQPSSFTTSNAHSHNDYEQLQPFWEAYNAGFGSIEADVFLVAGKKQLQVAHTLAELQLKPRSLDSLYLIPLRDCIRMNRGNVYPDPKRRLQLMIDIKTAALPTLQLLVESLALYPELTKLKTLQVVISGNRPSPDSFFNYPAFIFFDGELNKEYSEAALNRIVMMSDYMKRYSSWDGSGVLPVADSIKMVDAISRSHKLDKPVRLWGAPDNENTWRTLMRLGVDYINTDKIGEFARVLRSLR